MATLSLATLPQTRSDRERAHLIGRGVAVEVERFYRDCFRPLYAFVYHRVGGVTAEAEDITQEAFLTALRQAGSFDGRSTLLTWLCGIAKNKIRERRRRLQRGGGERLLGEGGPEIEALAKIDTAALPDAVIAARETRVIVGAAMDCLPPHYREVLVEKYVAGRSFVDIAERSNRSPKAVESTVQRAKSAFARVVRMIARARLGGELP